VIAPPTNKVLIVIPFWEGDKKQAMKMARLLADLEASHSKEADVLFVSRFDCVHDYETERYVSRKFNTFSWTSKRRGTGWPMGCNSLFFGAMEWCYHKINSAQVPAYKSILLLAGDGAPLRKDWLSYFLTERENGAVISGALIPDEAHPHINGDAILLSGNLEFLKWIAITVGDVSVTAGWDWLLSEEFKRKGWRNLPFVRSAWNKRSEFTDAEWEASINDGIVWYHGQKGFSLLNMCRKMLL
jgi:hypothetical protein